MPSRWLFYFLPSLHRRQDPRSNDLAFGHAQQGRPYKCGNEESLKWPFLFLMAPWQMLRQLDSFKDKPWRRSRDVAAVYKDQLPACLAIRIEFGLQLDSIVLGE